MSTVAVTITQVEAAGLRWWLREGTSDWSSIREVAVQRAYFTHAFKPEPGERWLDAGANIGAFACVAAAAGAEVVAYEPWPEAAELARANLRLNDLQARVLEKAVGLEGGRGRLGLSRSEWRHSLLNTGGKGYAVPVVAFADAIAGCDAAKLDIEGAERAILEAAELGSLRKLVFEWHFDHWPPTDIYLAVLDRLRQEFPEVRARKVPAGIDYRWFPPAAIVRCWR